MPQSSATPTVQEPRVFGWLLGRHADGPPDWARIGASVRGPLLTVAAVVLLDVLRRHEVALLSPFPVLLLTVVYAGATGGLRPALVSVVVTILYALHYFAEPGLPLRYAPDHVASLLAVAAAVLLTGLAVAHMHDRVKRAERLEVTRADAEALARRFGFLEQASLILTSERGIEAAFRDLTRLIVPTLADWCTIHLATEGDRLRFVAGAHRDATKDLVIRALGEYGDRSPPFTAAPMGQVTEVRDTLVRQSAADAEERKLYRSLSPTAVLRIPFESGSDRVGLVTLGTVSETGRRFTGADVSLAEELGREAGWPFRTPACGTRPRRRTAAPASSSRPTHSRCGPSTWTRSSSSPSTRRRSTTMGGPARNFSG